MILDNKEPELKEIGFIVPNERSTKPLSIYAVSIDYVESTTEIDFFHLLEDDIEELLESSLDLNLWSEVWDQKSSCMVECSCRQTGIHCNKQHR